MAQYRIYFRQSASASVEVEADSFEEAVDLAYEELPGGVCAQCSGWNQSWSLDLDGEWDVNESEYEVDGDYVEATR